MLCRCVRVVFDCHRTSTMTSQSSPRSISLLDALRMAKQYPIPTQSSSAGRIAHSPHASRPGGSARLGSVKDRDSTLGKDTSHKLPPPRWKEISRPQPRRVNAYRLNWSPPHLRIGPSRGDGLYRPELDSAGRAEPPASSRLLDQVPISSLESTSFHRAHLC